MLGRFALVLAIGLSPPGQAQDKPSLELPGLSDHMKIGQDAPRWETSMWLNLPEDKVRVEVDDYRGKVVVLFLFQATCDGCRDGGVPLFRALRETSKHPDVAYVAIQSVYEMGFANTFEAAEKFAEEFEFDFPVGHTGPEIMKRYRAFFSPWFIIIDREGKIRFSSFFVAPQKAKEIIDKAVAAPASKTKAKAKAKKKRYWF